MSLPELICAALVSLGMPNADVACEHMEVLVEVAEEENVDPLVLTSLIHVESRWTPTARSRSNACGLTQVLPKYSGGWRNRFGKRLTCKQLFDPETSIQRGTKILAYYLKKYRRSYRRSLCSYNAGPSRCRRPQPRHKGHRYATKVLKLKQRLERELVKVEEEVRNEEYIPGCYE
jgi:soluble lytic murein transglycosylase-like protein